MVDVCGHPFDGSLVRGMVITENRRHRLPGRDHFKDFPHVIFNGFGVRPSQSCFQYLASAFLMLLHTALPAQLTVCEVDEEVSVLLHSDVMVDGVVLAELE